MEREAYANEMPPHFIHSKSQRSPLGSRFLKEVEREENVKADEFLKLMKRVK